MWEPCAPALTSIDLCWPLLCSTAGLFRMVGYSGSTMVMANSVAMLILLLMVVTNGECLSMQATMSRKAGKRRLLAVGRALL